MESLNSSQSNKNQMNDENISSQQTNAFSSGIGIKPKTHTNNSIQTNSYQLTNNMWSKFKGIAHRSFAYTKENIWDKVKGVINHGTNINRAFNRPKFNFKNINLQILQAQDYTRIFPSNASLRNINSIQNIFSPQINNKTLSTKISAFGRHLSSAANKLTSFFSNFTHLHAANRPVAKPIQVKYPQYSQTKQIKTNINNELYKNSEKIYLGEIFFNKFQTSDWRAETKNDINLGRDEGKVNDETWKNYVIKYFTTPCATIFGEDAGGRIVYDFIFTSYANGNASRYSLLEKGMKVLLVKILNKTAELTEELNKLNNTSNKTPEMLQRIDIIYNVLSLIKGTLTDTSDNGIPQCSNRLKSIIENCASYLDKAENPAGETEDIIKKFLGEIKNTALNSVESATITDSSGNILGSAVKPEKMINTRHKFCESLGLPKPQERNNGFGTIPDNVFFKAIAKNLGIKKITESITARLNTIAYELKAKMLDDLKNEQISINEYNAIATAQNDTLNTKELTKQSIYELTTRIDEIKEQLKIDEKNNLAQEEIDSSRKELKDLIFLKQWLESNKKFTLPLKQIRETFMFNICSFDGFDKTNQLLSLFANSETKLLSELYIPTFLLNKKFLQLTM